MNFILDCLYFLYYVFVPRFVTEDLAFDVDDNGNPTAGTPVNLLQEGEIYQYVGKSKYFTWLTFAIGNVGEVKTFEDYVKEKSNV